MLIPLPKKRLTGSSCINSKNKLPVLSWDSYEKYLAVREPSEGAGRRRRTIEALPSLVRKRTDDVGASGKRMDDVENAEERKRKQRAYMLSHWCYLSPTDGFLDTVDRTQPACVASIVSRPEAWFYSQQWTGVSSRLGCRIQRRQRCMTPCSVSYLSCHTYSECMARVGLPG